MNSAVVLRVKYRLNYVYWTQLWVRRWNIVWTTSIEPSYGSAGEISSDLLNPAIVLPNYPGLNYVYWTRLTKQLGHLRQGPLSHTLNQNWEQTQGSKNITLLYKNWKYLFVFFNPKIDNHELIVSLTKWFAGLCNHR